MRGRMLGILGLGTCALIAGEAGATQVAFNFSGAAPSGHAASATFTLDDVANTVKIRIENDIDSGHNSLGSRALTGLFWDMTTGSLPFTSVTAIHGGYIGGPPNLTPMQLWAFRGNLGTATTPFATQFGLGASGFGVFGNANMLATGAPHPQPNGIDGGVLALTGNTYSGRNQNPMFRSFVEFTFNVTSSFFAGGIGSVGISDVAWQYGSGFTEPSVTTLVPLPGAVWAGMAGMGGLAGFGWLRRRSLQG